VRGQLLRNAAAPLSAATRLPEHYLLEIASGRTICESCQVALRCQRTSNHYPVGLALGQPCVRSIEKQCPVCHRIYRTEGYSEWVPPYGNHAFDLVVEVGLASFLRHRQNGEIQRELEARWGLRLSCSTIRDQGQAFLDYLAATHQARVPQLRDRLQQDGGYVLHVDGTCEGGTDVIFTAIAGNRGWTLASCKMATEDTDQIEAFLRRCVEWFGLPLALVRDLSPQIEAAHQRVMPGVPDLICHYHFLENVGTKLCEKHHSKLTACLRRLKVRPAFHSLRHDLVRNVKQKGSLTPAEIEQLLTAPEQTGHLDPAQKQRALVYLLLCWAEDYGADLQGEFFPFDLPSLAQYRRYRTLHDWVVETMAPADADAKSFRTLETVRRHLVPVVQDRELVDVAERLEKAAALFHELRDVLRLSSDGHPLLHQRAVPDGPVQALQREQNLQEWTRELQQRHMSENDTDRRTDMAIVLDYLKKYDGKLTGHVMALNGGSQPFVVHRTNNLPEHCFGRKKQGLRRRLGTRNLAQYVQAMRPEEFLVDNLRDPDYLQIICGGTVENLASSFAQNWQTGKAIRLSRKEKTTNRPIPVTRRQLRDDSLLVKVRQAIAAVLAREPCEGGGRGVLAAGGTPAHPVPRPLAPAACTREATT